MTDHCLIVEDEADIQEFIATVLRLAKIPATSCSNAAEMLKVIQEKEIRLIFLDLALNGSDAVEALQALHERGFHGTIQLMSGRGHDVMDLLHKHGEGLGFRMLEPLMKPFRPSAIRQILINENIISEREVDASIYEQDGSVLAGASFWCMPWLSLRTRKLDHVEVIVRMANPDPASHLKIIDFKAETSSQQLLVFRHTQAELTAMERGLALTETPFSVVLPSRLNHWKSIKISTLINSRYEGAAKSHLIVLDFSEEDVFKDLAAARDIMAQLRIQNIRIRMSGAGYKLASINGYEKLPLQEVVIASDLLNQRHEAKAHAAILNVIAYCKSTGATALAGLIDSSALGWVSKNGFDRYVSVILSSAASHPSIPMAEFTRQWSPYRTPDGSIIRRALPDDFPKVANH